jgi:DNA primase
VSYREALLLQTLINHPWLIEEHAETIAALPLMSSAMARLRDTLLSLRVEHNVLDRKALHAHLTGQGLAKITALVERAITHRGDKFAEPEADRAAVETGWCHALALHEKQVGLRRALAAAEQAWHSEGSDDALARICELQQLLNRSDGMETSIEGVGEGNFRAV